MATYFHDILTIPVLRSRAWRNMTSGVFREIGLCFLSQPDTKELITTEFRDLIG